VKEVLIVYDSLTGMGERVAKKLGYPFVNVNEFTASDEPVFLITRSFNFGEIPVTTEHFLNANSEKVVGVAVTGNRNWGENFGAAGDKINAKFNIPLVRKFEGIGFSEDIAYMKNWLSNYVENAKGKE
jgi:protein involved in ribonucleotide reduction